MGKLIEQIVLDFAEYCPIHPYQKLTIGAMGKYCPQCWDEAHPAKQEGNPWYVEITAEDIQEAKILARERQDAVNKAGNGTQRFFADETIENVRGYLGEITFGRLYGLPVRKTQQGHGDPGWDFKVDEHTINVKAAIKPAFLFRKVGEKDCETFVLGHLQRHPKPAVTWLGFEFGDVMLTMPVDEFGYGIRNHYKPAAKLRTMFELEKLLGIEKKSQ